MSSTDASIKAAQVVTQRVSVDDKQNRDGAEPIGRAFADLVDEAREANNPAPEGQTDASSGDDEQFAFSDLLDESENKDTASAFLVSNASLSETTQPVAGLLRNPGGSQPTAQPATAETTTQEIRVDTTTLFLPPDPNKPLQALADVKSTDFNALSWPPPENAAALQVAATTPAPQSVNQLGQAVSINAETVSSDTGPSANRHAARINATATIAEPATLTESAKAPSIDASQTNAAAPKPTAPQPQTQLPQSLVEAAATSTTSTPTAPTAAASLTATSAQPATPATAPSAATPPPALAAAPQATVQIYSRFIERFDGRAQEFQIRLDPPELGRVNVRIEISSDNRVHAVLATHDSNALADLLRGQRALEQSLANAGIDLADEGIRFELADQNANQSSSGQNSSDTPAQERASETAAQASTEADQPPPRYTRSRINLVA